MVDGQDRQRHYTKVELLEAAREKGFSPSARLIADWVGLGLLDQPTKRGLGKGRGTTATWPDQQLQLFLVLLNKKRETKLIPPLCNVPVGVWLYWGEQYVPIRQARRALTTWANGRARATSWRAALGTGRQLADDFAHPQATKAARERLIELVAQAAYGKPFNGIEILGAFREVFDPANQGRTVGPAAAAFTPEHYVWITEARISAVAALRDHQLDDDAYRWARGEYLTSRREYEQYVVDQIAADPEAARIFFTTTEGGVVLPDTTLEKVMNRACVDLLTVLGIYLKYRERQEHESS